VICSRPVPFLNDALSRSISSSFRFPVVLMTPDSVAPSPKKLALNCCAASPTPGSLGQVGHRAHAPHLARLRHGPYVHYLRSREGLTAGLVSRSV